MEETLKMMRRIIVGYEKDMSTIQIINKYKHEQLPNLLAYLFVQNYGIIMNISRSYDLIDTQDVASLALQELDKSILIYDETKNCSFITFFVACFKNRLRYERQLLLSDIRKANFYSDSIHEIEEKIEDTTEYFECFDINNYNLSENEKKQCKLLLHGFSSKEISEMLKLSKQSICYRNKIIRKKLLNNFNF